MPPSWARLPFIYESRKWCRMQQIQFKITHFCFSPFCLKSPKGRSESPLLRKNPALSCLVSSKKGGRRLRIDLKKGEEITPIWRVFVFFLHYLRILWAFSVKIHTFCKSQSFSCQQQECSEHLIEKLLCCLHLCNLSSWQVFILKVN